MNGLPAPKLLAIDTAADRCSVALAHAGRIDALGEPAGQRHLERVLPMIDRLLADCGIGLRECDAIAFGSGPGSFTGLRIACGIAQGLAFGIGRPVIAIDSLRALAHASGAGEAGARCMTAIDARMRQVYWSVFDWNGGQWRSIAPPALADAGDLPQLVEAWRPTRIAGNALASFADAWGVVPAGALQLPAVAVDATAIAALACVDFRHGRTLAPDRAAPLYVRDEVALTIEQRRAAAAAAGGGARP